MDQPQHYKTNSHDQQNKVPTVTFHQRHNPKIGPLGARVKNESFSKLKGLVVSSCGTHSACIWDWEFLQNLLEFFWNFSFGLYLNNFWFRIIQD